MSASLSIPGRWDLETLSISHLARIGPPSSTGFGASARFEPLRFDILSSSSNDDEDELFDTSSDSDFFAPPSSKFSSLDLDTSGCSKISNKQSMGFSEDHPVPSKIEPSCHSEPIDIALTTGDKNKDARIKRVMQQKSKRSATELSREEAWERKRLSEELKHADHSSGSRAIGRSSSDCGKSNSLHSDTITRTRTSIRSLTDDDFEELRGCIDLGFRFGGKEDPKLCNTLPALEVCYAVTRQYQDLQSSSSSDGESASDCSFCDGSWMIASPGDEPQQVKEKLRHWARAVACTVRQSC